MIEMQLRVEDARQIIFPHPTVSEIIREALWLFDDYEIMERCRAGQASPLVGRSHE